MLSLREPHTTRKEKTNSPMAMWIGTVRTSLVNIYDCKFQIIVCQKTKARKEGVLEK